MRMPLPIVLAVFCIDSLAVKGADTFERDPTAFEISDEPVPTDVTRLVVSDQPKKVALGSDGSTFDLWENGIMHLEWSPKRVLVYPLDYLGKFGSISVYREDSPSAWIWYFYPDGRLYFFANGMGPYLYDSGARYYDRLP